MQGHVRSWGKADQPVERPDFSVYPIKDLWALYLLGIGFKYAGDDAFVRASTKWCSE
jgi:hypothetical protein